MAVKTRVKNKVNKKTGEFMCGGYGKGGCGQDIGMGVVINGYVYCSKCAEKLKGKR